MKLYYRQEHILIKKQRYSKINNQLTKDNKLFENNSKLLKREKFVKSEPLFPFGKTYHIVSYSATNVTHKMSLFSLLLNVILSEPHHMREWEKLNFRRNEHRKNLSKWYQLSDYAPSACYVLSFFHSPPWGTFWVAPWSDSYSLIYTFKALYHSSWFSIVILSGPWG